MIGDVWRRDVRQALRSIRREPVFVAGVVATFAAAIGANATMFGLVDRLMLSAPPGIRAPEEVARIRLRVRFPDGESFAMPTTSYPVFSALRRASGAFVGVAAARRDTLTVGRGDVLTRVAVVAASGDYFTVLGATPAAGCFFGPGDDELPSGNPVVVLGYEYWHRAFAANRGVIGQKLILNDRPFVIVGVAQRGFNGDDVTSVDAFVPLSAALRDRGGDWMTNRNLNLVSLLVRSRNGVAPTMASQVTTAGLREETSAGDRSASPSVELEPVVPGQQARASAQAQIAIWLIGVALIVLVIATANVGTLFALRGARRRRELAVRVALGASTADLARSAIVEAMILSIVGAAVGLLLSGWFAQVVHSVLLPSMATDAPFTNPRVLAASIVLTTFAGLGSALAPAIQSHSAAVMDGLRVGDGQAASERIEVQRGLLRAQTALAMLLLVGAALFVRSLDRVQSQDLGFDSSRLLYVTLDFRQEHLAATERDRIYRDVVERLRSVRDVERASVAAGIPFGPHNIPPVSVPGVTWPAGRQLPIMYGATPDYLAALDVRLVSGRLIAERDARGAPQVVLVNETMARTAWPGQSPLGKCVRAGFGSFPPEADEDPSASTPCREVVGVVRDSRARSLRPEHDEDRLMQYYVPFEQIPAPPFPNVPSVMGVVARTRGDAPSAVGGVQQAVQSLLGRQAIARVEPYQELIDPQMRSWKLGATLFSAFGGLALGIAVTGLVGVVSYVVTQRTREIGVRIALGASRATIVRLVMSDALRMAGVGIAVGAVAALAAGPLVASLLFHTSPRDLPSLGAAAAVLLVATLAAAALPAWRAASVQPVTALRADA
jgi:predicted permease